MTFEFGKKLIERRQPAVFVNISTTYAETGSSFVAFKYCQAGCNNLTEV